MHFSIDLFAGAGGLSQGFKSEGFKVCASIEKSAYATKTYQANHSDTTVFNKDIKILSPKDILVSVGLNAADIKLIFGGPPCQGFSESNRRTRSINNPNNHLYLEFLRFAEYIKPDYVVIENVAGLRTLSKGVILANLIDSLMKIGYHAEIVQLNAIDYGIPQIRRRLFILGKMKNDFFQKPTEFLNTLKTNIVTVREAISDLPDLQNGFSQDYMGYKVNDFDKLTPYQISLRLNNGDNIFQGNLVTNNSKTVLDRYKYISPGNNWTSIPNKLMKGYKDQSRCHTGIYHRLEWDKPSKVIGNFRKNMLIHPSIDRGLSVREAARLQSFPDNYVFTGSIGFQQQQVADAVPPMLAKTIACYIRHDIEISTKQVC